MIRFSKLILTGILALGVLAQGPRADAQAGATSKPFAGAKVNGGTVTHAVVKGQHVLSLSADFKVPDTPDPHWQVVDTSGRVYLLQRLGISNAIGLGKDKINTSITLPAYITDVAKVQIYCSWAEAVLGEASFETRITTARR